MTRLMLTLLFIALAGVACKSEIDNKPAAVVAEEGETAEANEEAEEAEEAKEGAAKDGETKEVAINTEKSSIEWVGAKVTGDHTGGFKKWDGKATLSPTGELQKVSFEVDTRSVFSDNDKLTGHLMSEDFFEVEKFPKASFESTGIKPLEGDGGTHTITGKMTIRENTKTISFPATVKSTDDAVTASSEFTLKRFDFGIEYKGKPDDLIKEEVLMKINLEVPKS